MTLVRRDKPTELGILKHRLFHKKTHNFWRKHYNFMYLFFLEKKLEDLSIHIRHVRNNLRASYRKPLKSNVFIISRSFTN